MGLSLGYKERIVTTPADITFSNVTIAAGAMTAAPGDIKIVGTGTVVNAELQKSAAKLTGVRAAAPVFGEATIAVPALTEGSVYTFTVYLESSRYQAEVATDFVHFTRPQIIQFTAGASATATATAIEEAFNKQIFRHVGIPPISEVTRSTADLTFKTALLGVSFKKVEYKEVYPTRNVLFPTQIAFSSSTDGYEGRNTGFLLEQDHQMSTPQNVNPYKSNAFQIYNFGNGFSEFTFAMRHEEDEEIATVAAGAIVNREHKFVIYVDEAQPAGGAITGSLPVVTAAPYQPTTLQLAIKALASFIDLNSGVLRAKDELEDGTSTLTEFLA